MPQFTEDKEQSTRLIWYLAGFLSLAIMGITLAVLIDRSYYHAAKVEAERYQSSKAQTVVNKIRGFLSSATQLAETLRVLLEKYDGSDRKSIEEYLDRILESSPEDLVYGTGAWYEPSRFEQGNTYFGPYVHRGEKPGERVLTYEWTTKEYNFHQQAWYQAGVQANGKPSFTEPYLDAGIVYMTMALSFRDRKVGNQRGVISVDMILPQLQVLIDAANQNSRDVVYIVGKSNKILAFPEAETFLKSQKALRPEAAYASILDIPEAFGVGTVADPLVYRSQMDENEWKVVVASPEKVILAAYHSTKVLIYVCLAAYLLASAICFGLVYYFTEKVRVLKVRALDAIRHEKNQLAAIVDNVSFGLLRADKNGKVQEGFSASCTQLLASTEQGLKQAPIANILGLSERDRESFQVFYAQIFDQPFLAEEMVKELPSRYLIQDRALDVASYPIMKGDAVESILFVISDATQLKKTEAENTLNRSLLRIIQNQDRFRRILAAIYAYDDKILSSSDSQGPSIQDIRREVHTWKGDLSTFGLTSFVEYVHNFEDELTDEISYSRIHEYIHQLKNGMMDFIEKHREILKISRSQLQEVTLTLPESALQTLWVRVSAANSLPHAVRTVEEFVTTQTMQKAGDLLNYLTLATLDVSRKLKKPVSIQTSGADVALPRDYREIFDSLIHVVRNAVDHGLESPGERGRKDPTGKIALEVRSKPDSFQILISDDGRGVDLNQLKIKVLSKQLVTEAEWNRMNDNEKILFIFKGNISTKDTVTDISGRGIGLDYVYASVKNAGGHIVVESNPGTGTCFYISLPKFLAKPKLLTAV